MNDNVAIPNPALHAHVTSSTFVLTLKPSHIKWLWRIATGHSTSFPRTERCDFSVGVHGCISRGLVEHRSDLGFEPHKKRKLNDPISRWYRLTKAGWATLDLLAEAGMVDAIDRRSPLRRMVA